MIYLAIISIIAISIQCRAADSGSPVSRRDLLTQEVHGNYTAVVVKEVTMKSALAAGAHTHPCPVFGTIIEGSIVLKVQGEPECILKAGDAFYEPANTVIEKFDNPGPGTARFTAFYLSHGEKELIAMKR